MANYVILDTCIYRELGLKFYENLEYKNLCNYTIHTDGEVLLSNIVVEEFCNFYKSQIRQKTNSFIRSAKDLERDPFFKATAIKEKSIELQLNKSINKFKQTLNNYPGQNHPIAILRPTFINGLVLTKFILESKEVSENNIQIRDYLIWDSILAFAKREREENIEFYRDRNRKIKKTTITFITKDKGFEQNELFQKLRKSYKVNNIRVEKSITDFLEKKGFYFNFITADLIKQKITTSKILRDLNKNVSALLTYVSKRYYDNYADKQIIKSEVEKFEIVEHYTYLDSDDKKYKFIAHLKVFVNVVFERDEMGYKESLEATKNTEFSYGYLETYDEKQRPFFRNPIWFLYGGQVSINDKSIKSVRFFDFMPDYYL